MSARSVAKALNVIMMAWAKANAVAWTSPETIPLWFAIGESFGIAFLLCVAGNYCCSTTLIRWKLTENLVLEAHS